jgi:hypothetical protein
MAGLVPAIRPVEATRTEDVDARDKRGHDGSTYFSSISTMWILLDPVFLTARVAPASCQ